MWETWQVWSTLISHAIYFIYRTHIHLISRHIYQFYSRRICHISPQTAVYRIIAVARAILTMVVTALRYFWPGWHNVLMKSCFLLAASVTWSVQSCHMWEEDDYNVTIRFSSILHILLFTALGSVPLMLIWILSPTAQYNRFAIGSRLWNTGHGCIKMVGRSKNKC